MNIAQIATRRYTTKAFDPSRKLSPATIDAVCTLLRNSPSSVNSQPWHFFIAASDEAKSRIAKATHGGFAYNEPKVRNASHLVVLCGLERFSDAHLSALLAQEQQDGRFASPEAMANQDKARRYYVGLHQNEMMDEASWIERQVYIALGTLLLGAGALGVDACPMEGFDAAVLEQELGLKARGLKPLVLVALGHHSNEDFNAGLPKSRLPQEHVCTVL